VNDHDYFTRIIMTNLQQVAARLETIEARLHRRA